MFGPLCHMRTTYVEANTVGLGSPLATVHTVLPQFFNGFRNRHNVLQPDRMDQGSHTWPLEHRGICASNLLRASS